MFVRTETSDLTNIENYSTSAVAIGIYGGRTLYRKIIPFDAVAADTETTIASGYVDSSYIIVSLSGIIKNTDGAIVALGHYHSSSSYSALWISRQGDMKVKSKVAGTKGLVTLLYTPTS